MRDRYAVEILDIAALAAATRDSFADVRDQALDIDDFRNLGQVRAQASRGRRPAGRNAISGPSRAEARFKPVDPLLERPSSLVHRLENKVPDLDLLLEV